MNLAPPTNPIHSALTLPTVSNGKAESGGGGSKKLTAAQAAATAALAAANAAPVALPSYQNEIQQMMFVFGEIQDPLDETTLLVEDIVKRQVTSLIAASVAHSIKRGSRSLAPEDLIFHIRHDRSKVNRLRSFLSWKNVRKNNKEKTSTSATAVLDIQDELLEEADLAVPGGGPASLTGPGGAVKVKKMAVKFSWDPLNVFKSVLEDEDDDADEDERLAYEDQVNRLAQADKVTRNMSKEEYMHYTECRQSSFTYKKAKKFGQWCELQKFSETKGSSDIIDSLGFLCHETLGTITETALKIKKKEDDDEIELSAAGGGGGGGLERSPAVPLATNYGLFAKPRGERLPIQPRHVQEAYRILQGKGQHQIPLKIRGTLRRSLILI